MKYVTKYISKNFDCDFEIAANNSSNLPKVGDSIQIKTENEDVLGKVTDVIWVFDISKEKLDEVVIKVFITF